VNLQPIRAQAFTDDKRRIGSAWILWPRSVLTLGSRNLPEADLHLPISTRDGLGWRARRRLARPSPSSTTCGPPEARPQRCLSLAPDPHGVPAHSTLSWTAAP
jgi:hypothetical protein